MSTKQKESKKDQRQFWQMAIETWQSSGLSIRQFCKQEGLSEPSFYSWRKRLTQVDESDADKEAVSPSEPFIQVSLPNREAWRIGTCSFIRSYIADQFRRRQQNINDGAFGFM